MATKIDLAVAAIIALRQQGSEPTFAAVQKLVKVKGGEDISQATFYQAQQKIKTMADATETTDTPASLPPPPERPLAEPAPQAATPRLPVERFLLAVEAARTLLQAVDGDKEAASKIINSL